MDDFVHVSSIPSTDPLAAQSASRSNQPAALAPLDFLALHPFIRKTTVDKIYGCIFGSALGDTIGLYTEFLPKAACEQIYTTPKFSLTEPVTELYNDSHRNRFDPCAWTDDTDQALLILLSFLHHRSDEKRLEYLPQDFSARLHIWISQGLLALNRPPCGIGALVSSVVLHKSYLQDPIGTATNQWIKTGRRIAPNGSLMRTHPIGVIGVAMTEEGAMQLAGEVGRTTHVDPRCVVSCCVTVALVRGLLRGEVLDEGHVDEVMAKVYEFVRSKEKWVNPGLDPELSEQDVARHLDRSEFDRHVHAKSFEELQLDDRTSMGYTYKCLGSGILTLRLAMRATSGSFEAQGTTFEDLVTQLIMQGGDADTNAAVAGALLGAFVGFSNLPTHWQSGLQHRKWLLTKVKRLATSIGVIENSDGGLKNEPDEAPTGGKELMDDDALKERDRDLLKLIMARHQSKKEKGPMEKKKQQSKGIAGWFTNS